MHESFVASHLSEALEELQRTISSLQSSGAYSEEELQVALEHAYHHLNTAWNGRNTSPVKAGAATDAEFTVWGRFPADLVLPALASFPASVQCSFCGDGIVRRPPEPLSLLIPLEDSGAQELFSHLSCLRDRLHPSVPLAVLPTED